MVYFYNILTKAANLIEFETFLFNLTDVGVNIGCKKARCRSETEMAERLENTFLKRLILVILLRIADTRK